MTRVHDPLDTFSLPTTLDDTPQSATVKDLGPQDPANHQRVTDLVAAIVEARRGIDEVKGMLMLMYGIGADEAFEVLRAQARRTRTNVHDLAEQFRYDVAALEHQDSIPSRATLNRLFLTAHSRIVS